MTDQPNLRDVEATGRGELLLPEARRSLATSPWALRPEVLAELTAAVHADGDLVEQVREVERRAGGEAAEAQSGGYHGAGGGAVAVVNIAGIIKPRVSFLELLFGIGGATPARITKMLRNAVADSAVGSIVLNIDSPGGHVDGIPELAAEIRTLRAKKPIVAVANTVAASGAYWIAAQASELWVTPSGSVGSIGVYTVHEDWSGFDARLGVKTTLVSAGKYKTEGNPFEPLGEEARAAIQARIDEYYGMFTGDVAEGRGVDVDVVRNGYGQGRMLLAAAAVDEGMADRVGTLEDAIAHASTLRATGGGAQAETPAPTPSAMPPASPATTEISAAAPPPRISTESLADPRMRGLLREALT